MACNSNSRMRFAVYVTRSGQILQYCVTATRASIPEYKYRSPAKVFTCLLRKLPHRLHPPGEPSCLSRLCTQSPSSPQPRTSSIAPQRSCLQAPGSREPDRHELLTEHPPKHLSSMSTTVPAAKMPTRNIDDESSASSTKITKPRSLDARIPSPSAATIVVEVPTTVSCESPLPCIKEDDPPSPDIILLPPAK